VGLPDADADDADAQFVLGHVSTYFRVG
jgi:hypothetical protein